MAKDSFLLTSGPCRCRWRRTPSSWLQDLVDVDGLGLLEGPGHVPVRISGVRVGLLGHRRPHANSPPRGDGGDDGEDVGHFPDRVVGATGRTEINFDCFVYFPIFFREQENSKSRKPKFRFDKRYDLSQILLNKHQTWSMTKSWPQP